MTRSLWNEARFLLAMAALSPPSTNRDMAQAILTMLSAQGSEKACCSLLIEFADGEWSKKDLELFAKVTQRGRLALGNWYARKGKIDEAQEVYETMDVIHKNKLAGNFRSDDVDELLARLYNELAYIADSKHLYS
eukprot:m.13323 g.13323  ORF g.13323 m.13323 type:complete len:135 (+) comp4647_c0_seq1:1538-1942(+)